jgi:radical SAM protein with 4Fe4S-binding SPASM domain
MGGQQFAFVSHVGVLSPCGYLEIDCGSVRREGFRKAWLESPVFQALRRRQEYHGKCSVCEYRDVCGGCRARAYAATGDYLAEEPCCIYRPEACH